MDILTCDMVRCEGKSPRASKRAEGVTDYLEVTDMADSTEIATTTNLNPWRDSALELWEDMAEEIEDLDGYAKAPATIAGYCSDWSQFAEWCRGKDVDLPLCDDDGRVALPAEVPAAVIKAYVTAKQYELKSATIARHLSAVKHFHTEAGLLSPTDHPAVKIAMKGLNRKHRYSPRQAGALRLYDLQPALPTGDGPKAIRDRALLTWGFWSAMRRSEIVVMTIEDLEWADAGAVLLIPFSKTDQEAKGEKIAINHQHAEECAKVAKCSHHGPCPVCELRGWIKVAGISSGPIWRAVDRHGNITARTLGAPAISEILKARVSEAGINPAPYSAHSLRSGFVSTMDDHGVPRAAIRAVTRHKSDAMLSSYARPDQLLRDSAGAYMTATPLDEHDRRAESISQAQ